jgi:hypothetical protein
VLFTLILVSILMCVIPQVEDFANYTFGKNEDRKRKLVYVGVDDYEVKVRSFFTMLLFFSTLLKKRIIWHEK